jgi:hypothetical protein
VRRNRPGQHSGRQVGCPNSNVRRIADLTRKYLLRIRAGTTTAGSNSITLTGATLTAGTSCTVSVLVPPVAILLGVKLLEMEGGPVTTSVATAELPVPRSDVTALVELSQAPVKAPLTKT